MLDKTSRCKYTIAARIKEALIYLSSRTPPPLCARFTIVASCTAIKTKHKHWDAPKQQT